MIKLDDDLLQELGLSTLAPEEKKRLLAHIYETLEMRVGMKLAEQMSDAQLMEFEQFIDRNDEAGALRWLETNFPNYKDVVSQEFDRLKQEIKQTTPQILAASQQPMPAPQMPPAQQPYPSMPAYPQQYTQQPQPSNGPYQPMPPVQPYGPQPAQNGGYPPYPPAQPQMPPYSPPNAPGYSQEQPGRRDDYDLAA